MMCTSSCILKRMKATPTAAQATRKSLKMNSRENQYFKSNFISSRYFTGLKQLADSFGYSGGTTALLATFFWYLGNLKGKMRKKRFQKSNSKKKVVQVHSGQVALQAGAYRQFLWHEATRSISTPPPPLPPRQQYRDEN